MLCFLHPSWNKPSICQCRKFESLWKQSHQPWRSNFSVDEQMLISSQKTCSRELYAPIDLLLPSVAQFPAWLGVRTWGLLQLLGATTDRCHCYYYTLLAKRWFFIPRDGRLFGRIWFAIQKNVGTVCWKEIIWKPGGTNQELLVPNLRAGDCLQQVDAIWNLGHHFLNLTLASLTSTEFPLATLEHKWVNAAQRHRLLQTFGFTWRRNALSGLGSLSQDYRVVLPLLWFCIIWQSGWWRGYAGNRNRKPSRAFAQVIQYLSRLWFKKSRDIATFAQAISDQPAVICIAGFRRWLMHQSSRIPRVPWCGTCNP